MDESSTSRDSEIKKKNNGTLKPTKIEISVTPVDKERISSKLGAAGFFIFLNCECFLFFFWDN